jgi:hypothetical protein
MSDPEAVLSERERHDGTPRPDWGSTIPFEGEPVPQVNQVADVVSRAVTGDLSRHDTDALCGLLLMRGVPVAECKRIAHYVTADRDTLTIARHPEIQPYYKPIKGATWNWYAV